MVFDSNMKQLGIKTKKPPKTKPLSSDVDLVNRRQNQLSGIDQTQNNAVIFSSLQRDNTFQLPVFPSARPSPSINACSGNLLAYPNMDVDWPCDAPAHLSGYDRDFGHMEPETIPDTGLLTDFSTALASQQFDMRLPSCTNHPPLSTESWVEYTTLNSMSTGTPVLETLPFSPATLDNPTHEQVQNVYQDSTVEIQECSSNAVRKSQNERFPLPEQNQETQLQVRRTSKTIKEKRVSLSYPIYGAAIYCVTYMSMLVIYFSVFRLLFVPHMKRYERNLIFILAYVWMGLLFPLMAMMPAVLITQTLWEIRSGFLIETILIMRVSRRAQDSTSPD